MTAEQGRAWHAAKRAGRCGCRDRGSCGHAKAASAIGVSPTMRKAADEWARRSERDNRARGQAVQRAILGAEAGRPGECGTASGEDIEIGSDGQLAWSFRGWRTCGWADCAYCGPLVRLYRLAELTVATVEAEKQGRIPIMLTLSPPHTRMTSVEAGLVRLEAVWRGIGTTDDKAIRTAWRKRWGIKEFFIGRECTLAGMNGAHPHFHALLYVDPMAAPGVAELLDQLEADGVPDAEIAAAMPSIVADEVARGFISTMQAWAEQRPRRGIPLHDATYVFERERRARLIEGWTEYGVQAVPAGVGAATYLAKLAPAMTDDELRVYATLTGLELTNASAAKVGGLSTTTAMAQLGGEWADSKVDVRRPQIRKWLARDPRRTEIAEGYAEWRLATMGRPLLEGSPGYYRLLPRDWEQLSDDDIVARAGEVVSADRRRRELWRRHKERIAAGEQEAAEAAEEVEPERQADEEDVDSDWARTVFVDPRVVAAWDVDDDTRAALMLLHDTDGPWGMVAVLAEAWARERARPAHVHEEHESGALRVGRHVECWRPGAWRLVPPDELAWRTAGLVAA